MRSEEQAKVRVRTCAQVCSVHARSFTSVFVWARVGMGEGGNG